MKRKFLEVLTIINGKNQREVENPNGEYPIYGSGGIIGYANKFLCPGNTVIIGRKGNINKPIYVDKPFWNVDTAFGLQADEKILLSKYLFYFCQTYNFERHNKTVTIPSLTKADLLEIVIDVPEIDLQEKICQELDLINSAICNRVAVLSQLDILVKSRFVEMFGDPVTNPHGWDKVSLSDLAEIKIGPFGTLLHKEDYITGGHALVNPSHIHDGNIVTDGKLTITDEKYAELSAYHLSENDVVMGRRGEMGRCAVVKESGLLCGTGSMIIRSYGEVRADFLQKIISFPSFKKTIEDMAVGQTMPNLNVPIVSRLEIIKPPTKVQDDYYAFVELTDKSKLAIQQSIEKLQMLKAKLMSEYFS